jgi:hypothetical protein
MWVIDMAIEKVGKKEQDKARVVLGEIQDQTEDNGFAGVDGPEIKRATELLKSSVRGNFAKFIKLIEVEESRLADTSTNDISDYVTESLTLQKLLNLTAQYALKGSKNVTKNCNTLVEHYEKWQQAKAGNLELIEAGCGACWASLFGSSDTETQPLLTKSTGLRQ